MWGRIRVSGHMGYKMEIFMGYVTQTAVATFLKGLSLGKKGGSVVNDGAVVGFGMRAYGFRVEVLGSRSQLEVINKVF